MFRKEIHLQTVDFPAIVTLVFVGVTPEIWNEDLTCSFGCFQVIRVSPSHPGISPRNSHMMRPQVSTGEESETAQTSQLGEW